MGTIGFEHKARAPLPLSAISSNNFLAYGKVLMYPPPRGIPTIEPAFIE